MKSFFRSIKREAANLQFHLLHPVSNQFFDEEFYLKTNPDVFASGVKAWQHYSRFGMNEGRQPFKFFDPEFYASQFNGLNFQRDNVLAHFTSVGNPCRLSPHPLFDLTYYEQKRNLCFDTTYDAITDFTKEGWKLGISCSPLFNFDYYCLQANKSLLELGNPILHYLESWGDGFRPLPLFDSDLYLEFISHQLKRFDTPLSHYIKHWKELNGRNTGLLFDADYFLKSQGLDVNPGCPPLLDCWVQLQRIGSAENKDASESNIETNTTTKQDKPSTSSARKRNNLQVLKMQPVDATIAIVCHNSSFLVEALLNSIKNNTKNCSYEVILVDSGSNDAHCQRLSNIDIDIDLTIMFLGANIGYAEAMNIAASHARGRVFCALNDDQLVLPNWLAPMCELLTKDETAGVVGPLLFYPDGRLQAGIVMTTKSAVPIGLGCSWPYDEPAPQQDSECDLVANTTVRLKDLQNVDGLDFRYEPYYYEDLELCRQLVNSGKRVICCSRSQLIHYLSSTTRRTTAKRLETERVVAINRHIFNANSEEGGRNNILLERATAKSPSLDEQKHAQSLIIFGSYPTHVGTLSRFMSFALMAACKFARVTLALPHPCSRFRINRMAANHGIDISNCKFELTTWKDSSQLLTKESQSSLLALDEAAQSHIDEISTSRQLCLSLEHFQPKFSSIPLAPLRANHPKSAVHRSNSIYMLSRATDTSTVSNLHSVVHMFQSLHFDCAPLSRFKLDMAFHIAPCAKRMPELLSLLEFKSYSDLGFHPNPTFDKIYRLACSSRFALDGSLLIDASEPLDADALASFLEAVGLGCVPIMHSSTANILRLPSDFPCWHDNKSLRTLIKKLTLAPNDELEALVVTVNDAVSQSPFSYPVWQNNFWVLESPVRPAENGHMNFDDGSVRGQHCSSSL